MGKVMEMARITAAIAMALALTLAGGRVAFAADEFGAGNDIAPLVAAAHLQGAVVVFPQVVKIVTLH